MTRKMDFEYPVEIAPRCWWVGMYMQDDPFQCHPYLIENGDESILIDPGSMLEFDHVIKKISQTTALSNIKYIVLHHQDPDLAAAVPAIEKLIQRDDLQIVSHSRMSPLLKHYGISSSYYEVDKHNMQLKTKNGLCITFIATPYCHSPGAFVTYEPKNKILFSGDIFGGIEASWSFYAGEDYFEQAKQFHSEYMPSREIFNYTLNSIEALEIDLIAPQHGSIIQKPYIERLINQMKQLECGLYIDQSYHESLLSTIEELEKKKNEIKQEKLKNELVLEASKNAIIALNKKKEVIIFNKSAEQMFGYSKEEMLHSDTLFHIIPAHLLEAHNEGLSRFLHTGVCKYACHTNLEVEAVQKNGEIFPIRINFGFQQTDDDVIIVANIQDLTYEKQKEEILQRQNHLAQMGEMLGMIAHQWKQPLSAISTSAVTMGVKAERDLIGKDEILAYAKKINSYTDHLNRTMDDFRNFFKPNKNRKKTSCNRIVAMVLDIVKIPVYNKGISLYTDLGCNENLITYGNELNQVVLNLIQNAEDVLLEREVENPTIWIRTYREDELYVIEVRDNAGGIDMQLMDSIFDMFVSTKLDKNGTGLGLYMSKIMVEEHCMGKLDVSNASEGACFKVMVPSLKVDALLA
ncbi:histidine kinase [hydrothermal vent metagenome]|uniref:Histidine kinase n=1 Tax=hydrothermal vent metagenome TaxID=652676 RepID=A0A1W1BZC2_9ZZZZ